MTKLNLNVNEQARKEANLRLLKRSVDRSITDILGGATHVVLYHFREESQSWEKSEVEGSLSLAVRATPPPANNNNGAAAAASKYVLVILNRNSPENYPMDFTSEFQLQLSDAFLIFKNYEHQNHSTGDKGPATIRGVWFPNNNEQTKMNNLLVEVLESLKNSPPPPAPAPAPVAPTIDRNAATASLFAALNIGIDSSSSSQQQQQPPQQQHQQQQAQAQTPPTAATAVAARSSTSSSTTPSPSHSNQQPILDKKSLQLALLSLIQDERFLDLLHAQYLKVHNARTSRN